MVKSRSEIERSARRSRPTRKLSREAIANIKSGMTETDLAAELEYRMRRNGAEKPVLRNHRRFRTPDRAPPRATYGGKTA